MTIGSHDTFRRHLTSDVMDCTFNYDRIYSLIISLTNKNVATDTIYIYIAGHQG